MSGQAEGSKEETAYHEAGHAVIGCVRQRYPLSVSIVSDGKGAVGKTEFEQDAPRGAFRYFDDSDEKKRYIRTRVLIEVAGTIAHDIKYPGRAHDEGDANDDHWARQLVTEGVRMEDDREGAARSNFLVHVNVLARLFRGKMLAMLMHAHDAGELTFFNTHAGSPRCGAPNGWSIARRRSPGPSRCCAICPVTPSGRYVLPMGFHRIRHYGLFASTNRAVSIATARALLDVAPPAADPQQQPDVAPDAPRVLPCPCPCCGGRMIVIELFASGCQPSWRPTPNRIRI